MKSQYDPSEAPDDPLARRAYTSRLLGREPSLVLCGGGNTSVKTEATDFFGDPLAAIYVKGSGVDMAGIGPEGFSPVRLGVLQRMAQLETLSDTDMVREQRAALLDPSAPNPSVEAILHALIPLRYVDHTHADAIVTLTSTPDGEARIREIYGDRVLYVPYVMPGFVLARKVFELTRDVDWSSLQGLVLLKHGMFTFADDARTSYERMIDFVSLAEDALADVASAVATAPASEPDLLGLAELRRSVSEHAGRAMIARFDGSPEAVGFASRDDVADLATRGPVTCNHVVRTKRIPVVLGSDVVGDIEAYVKDYAEYFARHDDGSLTMLDPAPRFAVWKGRGLVSFGVDSKVADEVADIVTHTVRCEQWGEALGGWSPISPRDVFDVEYWELEQRKLERRGPALPFAGRVALISGGAAGIGRATAQMLRAQGAAVCVLDIRSSVTETFDGPDALGLIVDVTDRAAVDAAVNRCVATFGGLDILISNAGNFPGSQRIEEIDEADWARTIDLNLTSHMRVMRASAPFLERGVDPSILIIASKNVPAPGPGAAAYSASKAALTQLGRVVALELGPRGVRVNLLHPDKVFDTELWTDEKIRLRAENYGLTIDQYKRSNLLGIEVMTADVAGIACALVGPIFRSTTGAQIPVDGGNDRVI